MAPTEPEPNTLGALIRTEREHQGLSMSQLARLVDVDKASVMHWERNTRTPKLGAITALARALELPITQLMRLSGANPEDLPTVPAMLRAEYDLPPEAVERITRYITRIAKEYRGDLDEPTTNEGRNT